MIISALLVVTFGIAYTTFYVTRGEEGAYIMIGDVGSGDSIYIVEDSCPSVIVDGGPDFVLRNLSTQCVLNDCHISSIVVTHPHADHITGILRVLDFCSVDIVYYNDSSCNSSTCFFLEQKLQDFNVSPLFKGDSFRVGGFTFYVLWPEVGLDDLNDSSIVLLVDYGSFEALLTGDISSRAQEKLALEDYAHVIDNGIDVYKVPHHGAVTSFSEDFLNLVQPKIAVLSVGENSYGHPSNLFPDYFEDHNITVFRTDIHKNIKISF